MATSKVLSSPSPASEAPPAPRRPHRRFRREHPRLRGARARIAKLVLPGPGTAASQQAMWPLAVILGILASVALLVHLFVPGVVGMADQGDGQRLVCELGVGNNAPFDYTTFTQHIYTQWSPHQWYGEACGADGSGEPYYSSQTLLLVVAKWITPWFGWGPGLDTRAAGLVCIALFGILLTLLVALLPGRPGFRIFVALGVAAIMDDGIFADFFVSPYSEPACFLGILALLIALMFLWRRDTVTWLGILLVSLACAFTIGAKTQMISVLPVVVVALLWRPYRERRAAPGNRPGSRARRLANAAARRAPALIAALALIGFAGAYMADQPSRFRELNNYNAVFVEMLPHSPNPEGDLEWLGLSPSFADSAGTTVNSPDAAIYNPLYPEFLQKISQQKIVLFYVFHPDRLVSMTDRGLDAIAHPELNYLGSYPASSGAQPWAKEHRFPIVEGISALFAALPLLIVVIQLVAIALGIAVASRRRLGARANAFGRASVFFIVALWLQFWTVMLSDGASEIYKHMIVATFMSALCMIWLPALAMLLWRPAETAGTADAD
jgi:hypothetical protein